jgi:choline dehydrogenase
MGRGLGGGSSINAMIWARGHQSDWDFFASEAGDRAWSYESILNIYRRIEDWHGAPDPKYRGIGGPVFVQPKPASSPVAGALFDGICSVGIPIFENQNGRMMEADGGASVPDMRIRDGKRQSVFRSYVFPYIDRPNLTVLPHALVTRLTFEGKRATGVEIFWSGRTHRIRAGLEVIVSLGAMNTPKVLMQSGIGDETELQRFGIPVVQHLPGIGRGFQDHPVVACVWECSEPLPPDVAPDAALFWKSDSRLASPDFQILQGVLSVEDAAKLGLPTGGWTLLGNVVQPKSRGHIRLTGPDPDDPIQIEANLLCEPDDRKSLLECVKLCREIGNLDVLRPFLKQEILPGKLKQTTLEEYIHNGALSFWHETSTACMGRDVMSVVDGNLKVYGVDNLRIADGSIMPRVTTGNTMAPCVIIGERAAEIIQNQHQIEALSFPIHGRNRTRHDKGGGKAW